jgi:putative PEP-CTERM system TPR-repeat lipoprotein
MRGSVESAGQAGTGRQRDGLVPGQSITHILQEKRLLGLTRINNFLLTLATAAFMLTAFPAGHAADAPDPTQKTQTAADLLRRETELRNALKANPNDGDAHLQLGRIHLEKGNWTAAAAEARAAHNSGTKTDEADALLAWALYLEGKYNVLFRQVEPGQRDATSESMVRMSLGLANLYTFDFDRAEPLLRDAVRLDPDSYRARIALARLLILQRRLPEARELLDAARAIAPSEIGVTRITGELLRAEGDTAGAIAAFSKVLEVAPNSLPAIAGRIDALISENKLSEAQRDVTLVLRGNSPPQLLFLAALVLARQDKLAEADRLLTTAYPAFGHMPIGYYLEGVVRFRLGRFEMAEFDLAKFQGKQPDVPGVARLRAEIALHRKDPASAIKLLEPVVKANPADQSAVTELARAYLASGQSDQVLQLYERLAAASPEKVVAQGDPAGLLMMYGDAYGDLAEIEKVILTKAPDLVTPMTELRQGDLTKASALAESLAGSAPNDPVIQNLLGSVRLAQKRLPEAEAIFRGILDKKRDFTPAAFNLVQVLVAEQRQDEAKEMLHGLTRPG